MKKILIALIIAVQSATAVYAQTDTFLPEAENDFIYVQIPSDETATEVLPSVSPEVTTQPSTSAVTLPKLTAESFTADFIVEGNGYNVEKAIVFSLYDEKKQLIDEITYNIEDDVRKFSITFETPEYEVGRRFYVVCKEGAEGMRYYEDVYGTGVLVDAPTYAYTDENGENIVVTSTAMNIITEKEKQINIYVDNTLLALKSDPRLVDGIIMVPVREMSEALGVFDVTYHPDYESVRVAVKDKEILFNIGYPWTTVDGVTRVDEVATTYIGKNVYVPIATLAEGVASDMEMWEHENYYDILMTRSKHVINYIEKVNYINTQKLTSQTDYLIWISKAKYEVNVFKRSGGIWNFVNSYRCAIGTDETPTCVGTYRYYEKIDKWIYPDFYVGPVMRFNGGYAIHSTLLNFDGTDYNRAVGKKLSHGCVRIQPPDMQWLVDNIPMYTTVHVTNN